MIEFSVRFLQEILKLEAWQASFREPSAFKNLFQDQSSSQELRAF